MNAKPSLSFCITCKNRMHQIRHTLRKNLQDNRMHSDSIEFVLVDFSSRDGLREWITGNFQDELASGYLKYFYTDNLPQWHACVAKNTVHLCATGNILVNLDCDNFTGVWGGAFLIKTFSKYSDLCVVHQFGGIIGDGSYGRISVKRDFFYSIGGYDESFEPMGYQDDDLLERLTAIGLKYIACSNRLYSLAIPNTKEEGISQTQSTKNYSQMIDANFEKSRRNLSDGRLVANHGKFGIHEGLFDHKGEYHNPNNLL